VYHHLMETDGRLFKSQDFLPNSVEKGSYHSTRIFHGLCINSLEWMVTGTVNPIGSNVLDDSCNTSTLVVRLRFLVDRAVLFGIRDS